MTNFISGYVFRLVPPTQFASIFVASTVCGIREAEHTCCRPTLLCHITRIILSLAFLAVFIFCDALWIPFRKPKIHISRGHSWRGECCHWSPQDLPCFYHTSFYYYAFPFCRRRWPTHWTISPRTTPWPSLSAKQKKQLRRSGDLIRNPVIFMRTNHCMQLWIGSASCAMICTHIRTLTWGWSAGNFCLFRVLKWKHCCQCAWSSLVFM